jgi:TonB-dependent starch-binding outer membrane protein SusC
MKKSINTFPFREIWLKKLLRIMKIITLFMILGMMNCFAGGVYSQDAMISLDLKNSTLPELFSAIEQNTDYKIFYKTSIIDENETVNLSVENQSVSDLLASVLPAKDLTFDLVDKVIVITSTKNNAQKFKITGVVRDATTNEPLPGVNIQIEGTQTGVITDNQGKYSIEVPNGDAVLIFSYIGYVSESIAVAGRNQIDVNLAPDVTKLDEVVVVGYGTQSKRTVTGSVVSVGYDKFEDRSYSNVTQSLAGKLPGVNITQSQGAPGQSPIIKIRGSSSITAGTSPLYVIDGLPMENFNMNLINPQDIQSVEVLKDASSAAIYGSRGANGVILITTKLGKPGKAVISATYEYGIQKVTRMVDMMDAQQFIQYYIDAHNNGWIAKGGNASDPNSVRTSPYKIPEDFTDPTKRAALGKGTDWQDVAFRTAPSHNFQLSVSGGTEKTQYLISGAYLDQTAVLDNNYYKRLSLRTNVKQKLSDRFTIGGNLGFTGVVDRTDGTLGKADVVSLALQNDPIFPVYNENGNLGFKDPNSEWYRFASYSDLQLWHPYSMTREIKKQNKDFNSIGSAFLEVSILDGLKFRSSINGNLTNIRFNSYKNALQKYGYSSANPAEGNYSSSYMFNWLTENTLSYEKQFGNHGIKALIGYTAQKQRDEYSLSTFTNFPNDLVNTGNAGTVSSGTTTASEWSMISYIGRLNYDYKSKYFLTATVRRDGSSRFGADSRWGYFPSVSAGWLISDENFMKGITSISTLKLKTSYGVTGNNQIPNYGSISLMSASNYAWNNNLAKGLVVSSIANPDLKWEKTSQFNVGLEIGALDNRVYLSAEYYYSKTKDLLLNLPIPDITGFSTQLTNIGKLRNSGFELNLTSRNLVGKLGWTTDFNYSINRNKVLQLGRDNAPIIYNEWDVYVKTQVGQPISNFYGYKWDGVYKDQNAVNNSVHFASATPGDPIIRDVHDDGVKGDKSDNVINELDKTTLGNAEPDFTAGMTNTFTYKGVEFSFMLQGSYGGEIVDQQTRYDGIWNGGRNAYADVYKYWRSPEDPGDGKHFKPNVDNVAKQKEFSSYWVQDASFLRIKNIILSYNLPASWLSKFTAQSCKVYVNIENVYVFTKYKGFDPENSTYNATTYSATGTASTGNSATTQSYNSTTSTSTLPTGAMLGVDFGSYPIPRVVTFGVKLEF